MVMKKGATRKRATRKKMLHKRIIVCLDVRDGKVTKGIKFKGNIDIGNPVELAIKYYEQGVDELVFYDITASVENRSIMLDVVKDVARNIFIPFSVGGGVKTLTDMHNLLMSGAEKISVNSLAVLHPSLIEDGAKQFGEQCIVLGMDVLRDVQMPSGYRVVIRGGREQTDKDALLWAKEAVERGAGEIVLNSIDADGTKKGYDCIITKMITEAVGVPVIASGGAGEPVHLLDAFKCGADATLIASMVHYGIYTIQEIKEYLVLNGAFNGLAIRQDY